MIGTMIGVHLAKNVFQLHGASLTGEVKFRKKLSSLSFGNSWMTNPQASWLEA